MKISLLISCDCQESVNKGVIPILIEKDGVVILFYSIKEYNFECILDFSQSYCQQKSIR